MPTCPRNGVRSVEDASEDEESQLCPICLNSTRPVERAVPDACNHVYCLSCILRWAQMLQICPVDRRPFSSIYTQDPFLGFVEIPVKPSSTSNSCVCNSKDDKALESALMKGKTKKDRNVANKGSAELTYKTDAISSSALKKVGGGTCRSQLLAQHSEHECSAQQGETLGILANVM